jgi:hypothetical protein
MLAVLPVVRQLVEAVLTQGVSLSGGRADPSLVVARGLTQRLSEAANDALRSLTLGAEFGPPPKQDDGAMRVVRSKSSQRVGVVGRRDQHQRPGDVD